MQDLMPKLKEWLAQFGVNIVAALAILIIGLTVAKFLTNIARGRGNASNRCMRSGQKHLMSLFGLSHQN
jgi:hypothetical protein